MKAIYKFYQDFGRSGSLQGVFVAPIAEVDAAMGKEAYFGEVLGKHSEVFCTLSKANLTRVSADAEAVRVVEDYKLSSGWNPLDAIDEEEECA